MPGADCGTTWPRSAVPSNAPATLAMATSYCCSSALGIQPTLLILGAGKGFSDLISPDQNRIWYIQNMIWFTKAIIRFICFVFLLVFYIHIKVYMCIYIFKQADVLIWLQLDLV